MRADRYASTTALMDTIKRRRRRTWSEKLKKAIVAAVFAPGASVSVIARRYDVNTILPFTWPKLYGGGVSALAALQLLPVLVRADQPMSAPLLPAADTSRIELPRGTRVRVSAGVKPAAARLVLETL